MDHWVTVIGGGLAGSEAAWQIAEAGIPVRLIEMRPLSTTPAHKTSELAELVCSNSLKTEQVNSAPWLLKQELRRLDSLVLRCADSTRVPGGHALTVDRDRFSAAVTTAIASHRNIDLVCEELKSIPENGIVIVATGPLTSDALASSIVDLTGSSRLYFYDSISPIVEADSVDESIAFRASRYGKSLDGDSDGDYLNCPLNRTEYQSFVDALLAAECYEAHIDADRKECIPYFEGCLPIEVLASRGQDTLRFGPMKPVGLDDPRTGRRPFAVVQLRQENLRADSYNLVGFQTQMKFGDQARVFRMIPGLENARFVRHGQIHRNTYINGPELLTPTLQLRRMPRVFFAGQICGVEGYVESIATGLAAGIHTLALLRGEQPAIFPRETALGSLCHYVAHADPANYQPANITFDLLPPLDEAASREAGRDRQKKRELVCGRAIEAFELARCALV